MFEQMLIKLQCFAACIMAQCTATSKRSKERCKNWAIRQKNTCRMHGGIAKGPRTRRGRERARLAVLKHGGFSQKSMREYRELMCNRQGFKFYLSNMSN